MITEREEHSHIFEVTANPPPKQDLGVSLGYISSIFPRLHRFDKLFVNKSLGAQVLLDECANPQNLAEF